VQVIGALDWRLSELQLEPGLFSKLNENVNGDVISF